jgi:hypothetical protein
VLLTVPEPSCDTGPHHALLYSLPYSEGISQGPLGECLQKKVSRWGQDQGPGPGPRPRPCPKSIAVSAPELPQAHLDLFWGRTGVADPALTQPPGPWVPSPSPACFPSLVKLLFKVLLARVPTQTQPLTPVFSLPEGVLRAGSSVDGG